MKESISLFIFLGFSFFVSAQTTDKEFEDLYAKANSNKALLLALNKQDSNYSDVMRLSNETYRLLDKMYEFMSKEHRLNGKGSFSFEGRETSKNSVYKFGTGVSIDQGLYPYQLNFSADIQTLLNDGVFVANESSIDISFDFHPYIPNTEDRLKKYQTKINELQAQKNPTEIEKENNEYLLKKYTKKMGSVHETSGLWLENYLIAQRFSEEYLGIESRYVVGGGFIFSFYSNALTKKGKIAKEEISRKPIYKSKEEDLIHSLKALTPEQNVLQLGSNDIQMISDSRSRYLIANKKQNSKFKLSLLVGALYKLEKTAITNTINFNGRDTSMTLDVKPTHRFESIIRLGLVWKPKDKYKLKIHPYVYLPLDNIKNVVTEGTYRDEKLDYFIHLDSSLDIQVEKRFSINIFYRYFYDNAPSRVFLKQLDNTYVLLINEKLKSSFGIGLDFDF